VDPATLADPMLLGLALGLARRNALGSGCPAKPSNIGSSGLAKPNSDF